MSLIYTTNAGGGKGPRNSVYIGAKEDAKSLEKLSRWGVSRILNVTPAKEAGVQAGVPNFFEKHSNRGFVYLRIPVFDYGAASAQQLRDQAEKVVKFLSNGLFHGSVLVHCRHGVSRSTTCVLLYLMSKEEFSLDDAMALVKRRRPQAQPNPFFEKMLREYDQTYSSDRPSKKPKTAAIGPSISPTRSQQQGPQLPPVASSCSKAIGPSLPPSLTKRNKANYHTNTDKEDRLEDSNPNKRKVPSYIPVKSDDDEVKKTTVPIGPIFGPSPPPLSESNADSNPSIGPSLPPAKNKS